MPDSPSLPGRVLGATATLLMAATALYVACRLIQAIWVTAVLIVLAGALLVVGIIGLRRWLDRGW